MSFGGGLKCICFVCIHHVKDFPPFKGGFMVEIGVRSLAQEDLEAKYPKRNFRVQSTAPIHVKSCNMRIWHIIRSAALICIQINPIF